VIKPRFLPAAEAELLKEVAYYSNVRDGLGTLPFLPDGTVKISNFTELGSTTEVTGFCCRSAKVNRFAQCDTWLPDK
jgi:hypothetical protein